MLTRALYLSIGWFALSLFSTMAGGHRSRSRSRLLSFGWLGLILLAGDAWALLTFGVPAELLWISVLAFGYGCIWIWLLRDWNYSGQVTWAMMTFATLVLMAYAFMTTAFTPLNILSFIIAMDFFLLEVLALIMALTHAYEGLDLFCRVRWRRSYPGFQPLAGYAPMVSLHVPAYKEPPEILERTLRSLARLEYPNYEVLVVDNNTPNQEDWRRIHQVVAKLGPKFRFVHLENWPGYKSGALNFALAHTAPQAEIVGSIDADYMVEKNFLKELVPAFADPQMGFVQAPQDYREVRGNAFTESVYHGYQYFFEVSMPVRNEHNAIIFCGTMGLIRKSALQEIGGWDEWCITEDAEASLRLLKRGYKSLYVNRTYGRGLMPYSFDALKRQRFRWAFGGIQILKKHWSALMPWARRLDPTNQLTAAQRYFYLVGGLQWFTDLLNLVFGFFLALGAVSLVFYGIFTVRPLTTTFLVVPAIFLILHLWRFLWVLRRTLQLKFSVALRSMYGFFSLGWTVTLAVVQGLVRERGVFLRTPKARKGRQLWNAFRASYFEGLIGASFIGFGAIAIISRPDLWSAWLALLLTWQASLFLAAPYFSLLSTRQRRPVYVRRADADRGRAMGEASAARWAWAMASMVGLVFWVALQFPQPVDTSYQQLQPEEVPLERVVGLEPVPIEDRDDPPEPTPPPQPTQPPPQPTATPPAPTPAPTAESVQ